MQSARFFLESFSNSAQQWQLVLQGHHTAPDSPEEVCPKTCYFFLEIIVLTFYPADLILFMILSAHSLFHAGSCAVLSAAAVQQQYRSRTKFMCFKVLFFIFRFKRTTNEMKGFIIYYLVDDFTIFHDFTSEIVTLIACISFLRGWAGLRPHPLSHVGNQGQLPYRRQQV